MNSLLAIVWGALVTLPIVFLLIWYQTRSVLERIKVSGGNVNDVSLIRSPTRLSSFELISITFAILNKYILVFTGKAAQLRADPGRDEAFDLPLILVRGLLEINNDDFKRFRNAVPPDTPASMHDGTINPFFLVATTGPLVPYLLAHPNCPIKPLGAVNIRNIFVFHDGSFCRDIQAIKTASEDRQLSYTAAFGGPDRPGQRRQRGVEFSVTIDIAWNGQIVLTQELGFLQFLSSSTLPKSNLQTPPDRSETRTLNSSLIHGSRARDTDLTMNPQHPRKWAACCRDYNPIHMSVFMARLFGFKSIIAHGNHAVALAMQQLKDSPAHGEDHAQALARRNVWESMVPVTVDVKFVKPMVLPVLARVHWHSLKEHTTRADFEIYNGSTKFTVGSCSASSSGV